MGESIDASKQMTASELIKAMPEDEQKALKGWYWYDWANQAYALTIMTVIVPALMASLFDKATGGGATFFGLNVTGDSFYALVLGGAMVLVAVTAPALGVIADRMPIKKKLLYWYTVFGVIFTALMGAAPYFGSSGYMVLALTFVIGSVGFSGGNTIYYAFMPFLADKKAMDHVSSWGYAYGFMGGSILLLVHLALGMGLGWSNLSMSIIFVTSALWWWGWGALMFLHTPEPEVRDPMEYKGVKHATKFAYAKVGQTLKEIRKFRILAIYLVAYLMFYDGVNTINGMASAFGASVLRINPLMNIVLLLTVNIVAIPMSIVFGKLADIKGTKFSLMLALVVYCLVAVTAIGFAPLELEGSADHDRYDFQMDWNQDTNEYELTQLYGGALNCGDCSGEGDAAFKAAFPELTFTEEASATSGGILTGLSAAIILILALGGLGFAMMRIMKLEKGLLGLLLIFILMSGAIIAAVMMDEKTSSEEESVMTLDAVNASILASGFDDVSDHRFSISFVGGPIDNQTEVGDRHVTNLDQGGPLDWWPTAMREYVWSPLKISVSMQWIILGFFIGCVMGAAGAQARSMFSMLIPKTRTTEFFGFFGFIGKAAAVIGPFLYALSVALFDSRVAIFSIVLLIIGGTILCSRVDLEEGIRVAEREDELILGLRESE